MCSATSNSVAIASSGGTNKTIKGGCLILPLSLHALLIVLLTIQGCQADNSPNPNAYQITLPDGTNSSDIYLVGTFDDHRLADENDYTLVECGTADAQDMLCYAQQDDTTGDLVSTGTTIENPPPAGLQPGEDTSLERKEELCGQLCLDKQLEPINNCVYLSGTSNTLTNPLVDECPDPFAEVFNSNVHMNIGTGTEHAHLGIKQYFNADEDNVDRRLELEEDSDNSHHRRLSQPDCAQATANAEGNQGLTLQYTDLNGVNQCEDYAIACGGLVTDRMVKCDADGYGTITMHYNADPVALTNSICDSNPLPSDTCTYTFRVRCASDCAVSANDDRRLDVSMASRSLQATEPTIIRNLVVLFRFADHENRPLPAFIEYDTLMNAQDYSVRDVFIQSSNGNLVLNSDVLDWVTLDSTYTEAYCAGGRSAGVSVFHECLKNALDKVDPLVNFLLYDTDENTIVDSITFFHSGFAAEWGRPDEYGTVYQDRIWSHKWGMYPYWTSLEGIRVGKYHVNPGVWGVSGSTIGRIGVVAHETAHALGLKDRYDTSGAGNGLGSYSLMANSWGFDGSQRYPPKLSPCDKMELGWATIVEISTLGTYHLESQCDSDVVYKIGDGKFGLPAGEFFLFENRQNCGYDILVQPGLAIYHYDDKALDVMMDDRTDPLYGKPQGFPGAEGFPGDGKHYKCALVQADGLYELEKKANRGNAGDLFQPGQSLGPSNDPMAGPFPNTDSYQAGNLTQTGIEIHVGDFFLDYVNSDGSTGTNTGSTGLIRGRRIQQVAPTISFTLSATDGSPAAVDGATLAPTGLPTISRHPIDDSNRPSNNPSAAPVHDDSVQPSPHPSKNPVHTESARPSTYPSNAPVISASPFPSSATVTARADDTMTAVPSGQPSMIPSLLPDPQATNGSLCKESKMVAVDPFILRTVLLSIETAEEFDVTVEYKGEGDSMWNPFCHATNVVGQYPEYTLLPESSCTGLTVLGGEQISLRMTAQPTASPSGVIRRSLLREQDMPPEYVRLDSMYNYQENECAGVVR